MELMQTFGIEPLLFVAQIVNFLVIFYILKRFAYKPVLTVLKQREDSIKKGVKQAEEARILLEKAEEKEKQIRKNAQTQAKLLLEKTRDEQVRILNEARDEGKREMESMLEEARKQIAFETREAEKRLMAHVSEVAVLFLKQSLTEVLTDEDKKEIIDKTIKRLKVKRTN